MTGTVSTRLGASAAANAPASRSGGPVRPADHIAALEVRRDVLAAEILEQGPQAAMGTRLWPPTLTPRSRRIRPSTRRPGRPAAV